MAAAPESPGRNSLESGDRSPRSSAGPASSDREHQRHHEEWDSSQWRDREGREGDRAGMRFRVHQLHHQRVSIRLKPRFIFIVILLCDFFFFLNDG